FASCPPGRLTVEASFLQTGNAAAVPDQFPAQQRDGNQAGGIPLVDELAEGAAAAELAGEDVVQLHLADQVARPVPRLLQVKMLLAPNGLARQAQPSARGVLGGELRRLLEGHLIRVHAQFAQSASSPLREEHIDELSRSRP